MRFFIKNISFKAPTPKISNKIIVNKAIFYASNYPAAFNIIFWTSLIIALAVFGSAYMTCSMDPGTDTVIYRMTSQRMKKDQ
jgi:renin receptor